MIFDEPTSVLTPEESVQLFSSLRQVVAEEGRAVVLVSHKLDEVLHATDDISIMRQGKVVDRLLAGDTDAPTLARGMVGRDVSLRSESAALGVLVIDEDGAKALDSNASPDAVPAVSSPPILTIDRATLRGQEVRLFSMISPLNSIRAKLWASPASRATDNANSAIYSRASISLDSQARLHSRERRAHTRRSFGSDGKGWHRRDPRGPPRQRRSCST